MKLKSIAIVIAFSITMVAFAAESKGKATQTLAVATFVSGKAFYVRDSKTVKLKPNTFLYEQDRIFTEDGKADIQVGPHAILRLSPGSILDLADLFEQGDNRKILVNLKSGSVYTKIIKKLNKDSSFTIKSPAVVAGVRGTEFVVAENDKKASKKTEDADIPSGVFVNKGEVAVQKNKDSALPIEDQSIGDTSESVSVKQGQQVLSETEELKSQILDGFMKKKMEIFATLDVMKEKNYQALKQQRDRDLENLEGLRQKQKEALDRIKGNK